MTDDAGGPMRRAARLQNAAIHETHLYTPQQTVPGGPEIALPVRHIDPESALGQGLAAVRHWSDKEQGVALIVMIDAHVVSEHYGGAVGAHTRLNSYSMHKSVLALTVLAACDDGLIDSLDAPAGQYLDDWRDDARGAITIRHLLQMASGLELLSFVSGDSPAVDAVFGPDINAAARRLAAVEAPGHTFSYNNANSQLVGQILSGVLARAGRGTYADYLSRRLWRPLGNRDATLWLDREDGAPHYAMNLHATMRDWVRLGELIRNRGRWGGATLLSERAIDTFCEPSASNTAYGLHTWLGSHWTERRAYSSNGAMTAYHSAPFLADGLVYFDGFGGQRVYIIPSRGMTIVRAGAPNLGYDDAAIANGLITALQTHENSPAE